jgi:hypothetical protein
MEKIDAIARVVFAISLSTFVVLAVVIIWQEIALGM